MIPGNEMAPIGASRFLKEHDVVAAVSALRGDLVTATARVDGLTPRLSVSPRHGPRL
jgi:hypothetical protein